MRLFLSECASFPSRLSRAVEFMPPRGRISRVKEKCVKIEIKSEAWTDTQTDTKHASLFFSVYPEVVPFNLIHFEKKERTTRLRSTYGIIDTDGSVWR